MIWTVRLGLKELSGRRFEVNAEFEVIKDVFDYVKGVSTIHQVDEVDVRRKVRK